MVFANIKPYVRIQLMIAACLNIGHIVDGYSVAWTAPILPKLKNITESPLSHVLSEYATSWVVSAMYVGTFGSYIGGFMANIIGRKPCLIIGGSMIFLSYAILTFAYNIWMIFFGRFLNGFGVSFAIITSLIYIGEMSSPAIRGVILTSTGVFHAFGVLIVYAVGPFTTYHGVEYIAMGLALLYTFACFFVPETPVYYVIKGNEEAAKASLQYLGRTNDIENELKKMVANIVTKDSKGLLWRQLLFTKSNRKSLLISIPLCFFQMNSGIMMSMFYATTIFEDANSSVQPHVATIIIGVTSFLGAILSPALVERFGRRMLLIISTGGCCTFMTIIGAYFYFKQFNSQTVESLGWLPLAALVLGFISYAVGLAIIPNALTSEMFEINVRGLGSSVSYLTGLLSGFLSTTVSGYMMAYAGNYYAFWLFAAINLIALIFVGLVVPETAGKSLTEINSMMAN
ncbi:hypothetical protein K1T71_013497 [Dendrolimus kikuchii]|uniref:Uncharacterized protein n=1 Tax=Dendrolimus kikuchii TaxID=765133 RepID=A0ACC1CGT3_9NEOP|nr:hypothetical protein K1T71_013497 [Dendrolimus kikuchii]